MRSIYSLSEFERVTKNALTLRDIRRVMASDPTIKRFARERYEPPWWNADSARAHSQAVRLNHVQFWNKRYDKGYGRESAITPG